MVSGTSHGSGIELNCSNRVYVVEDGAGGEDKSGDTVGVGFAYGGVHHGFVGDESHAEALV